jgi:hypothetical protein
MSNALNASIANAWFSADIAANKFELYNLKREKEKEYQTVLDSVTDAQESAAKGESDASLFGSIVGAAIGFYVGGPAGAVSGWKIGGGVGEFGYDITHDESDLQYLEDEIAEFDWDLGQVGDRYQALESAKYEDTGEDLNKKTAKAFDDWQDDFYDPWYEDLINDVAIPIASQFTMSQISGFVDQNIMGNLGLDWYDDMMLPKDMANINPNTGLPYVYSTEPTGSSLFSHYYTGGI